MGSSRPKRGVEGQIGYLVGLGYARLNVAAAFAISFSARATPGGSACQTVKLRVESAGSEFLS